VKPQFHATERKVVKKLHSAKQMKHLQKTSVNALVKELAYIPCLSLLQVKSDKFNYYNITI